MFFVSACILIWFWVLCLQLSRASRTARRPSEERKSFPTENADVDVDYVFAAIKGIKNSKAPSAAKQLVNA